MKDPIVRQVREHRMEHARKFRGDLAVICEAPLANRVEEQVGDSYNRASASPPAHQGWRP